MRARERQINNLKIAIEALLANKVRSMLTALGIIFGVAAVIAMLAIGNGARQEILEQIRLVGVNNVVVTSVFEQKEEEVTAGANKANPYSRGLHLSDAEAILAVLPSVEAVSPEVVYELDVMREGFKRSSRVVGVTPAYFNISNLRLSEGQLFTAEQLAKGQAVCIVGATIAKRFFNQEAAIGNYIKVGNHWLKVVGVLEETAVSEKAIENLGIRDYNTDVYAPIKTVLSRYINRASVQQGSSQTVIRTGNSVMIMDDEEEEGGNKQKNYHQLDRLVVQLKEAELVDASTDVIARILLRRHNQKIDFEISVPEQLLKQQQRTKDIFNLVLGAIAGISLLVGGIGIMNIMLASVLERTREIGTRRALGATKADINWQFMFEALMISLGGGLLGVFLGVVMALLINLTTDIHTIISPFSVVLSFGVSAGVGLIFGISPARKAAEQNPIESLRYE